MKRGTLFFIIFNVSLNVFSNTIDCDPIQCFDPCQGTSVELIGDKCSVTWDEERKCLTAYAECQDSKKCLGVNCYDHCTGHYRYFKRGNTCQDIFDPASMCWTVIAKCE